MLGRCLLGLRRLHERMRFLGSLLLLLALLIGDAGAARLSAADAADHIGEKATVCGTVASVKYASTTRGQPTFLNLDQPYPRQIFTIVIWGEDRRAFSYAPESLDGTSLCVTGLIKTYRGVPEIVIRTPTAIRRR